MSTGFPPKAFIIGAQKSGTTQLADLLGQHPEVCLAKTKEPDIFSGQWSRGLESFRGEFSNLEGICLDASTSYSCACLPDYYPQDQNVESGFNGVAPRIKETCPEAQFIYLLRDPVARTFSSYWHEVRAGRETRPFAIAIRETSYYLRTSQYFGQLELYLAHFPLDRFLILTFEELIAAPFKTAQTCFRFLGVDEKVPVQQDRAQNKSFVYRGGWGTVNRFLAPIGGLNAPIKAIKPLVPRAIIEWGGRRLTKAVPRVSAREYALLEGEFSESIRRLSELTKRDYPWRHCG